MVLFMGQSYIYSDDRHVYSHGISTSRYDVSGGCFSFDDESETPIT